MSGIQQMLVGGASPGTLQDLAFSGQSYEDTNTCSGSISLHFYTDGTWAVIGAAVGTLASGTWLAGGNAANYEVRFSPTVGTASSNNAASYAAVTVTRTITVSQTGNCVDFSSKACTFSTEVQKSDLTDSKSASGTTLTAIADGTA